MIINGIVWLFLGNLFALLVARLQGGISIDVAAFYLIFSAIGIGAIYRATRSQLEFFEDKILYTHSLFKILCSWDDFIGLRISPDGVSLRFLNSRIYTLKIIALTVKYLGLWNNTIPLSPYLTLGNRMKIWDMIECNLEDDQEKKILELLLTG